MEEQEATDFSSFEFGDDRLFSTHDMEGLDGGDKVRISCSGCAKVSFILRNYSVALPLRTIT